MLSAASRTLSTDDARLAPAPPPESPPRQDCRTLPASSYHRPLAPKSRDHARSDSQSSAAHRTSTRRKRIPNLGAGLPGRETGCGRRKAESRRRKSGPDGGGAGQDSAAADRFRVGVEFTHCRTFSQSPQTASDMVKHSARPYASIFHARTLRTSAVSRRTAAACFLAQALWLVHAELRTASGARGPGSDAHRRGMEAVARTGHCRSSDFWTPVQCRSRSVSRRRQRL